MKTKLFYMIVLIFISHNIQTQNTFPNTGNVGIGTTRPNSKLAIYGGYGNASYPTTTSKGDVFQTISAHNNILEFGVSKGLNARRSWILSRHSDTKNFGKYYGTLHLQPDIGNKSSYLGVAIGFRANKHVTNNVGLAVKDNVTIGTLDSKGYKLAVAGKAIVEEMTVKLQSNWPDYVFTEEYKLPSLSEVEKHIKLKGHLADIPSAKDVAEEGIQLGEMNKKLLQKIEELTLYTIQQEKKLKKQENKIKYQEKRNVDLESRLAKLEHLLEAKK